MDSDVRQKTLYNWVPRIVQDRPIGCTPLINRGDIYGFEWTWQEPGRPEQLIVRVRPDRNDIAGLPRRQDKTYWFRLWISAMDIETNITDLLHVQLGGRFIVDVPWPTEGEPLRPTRGLAEVIRHAYSL